MGHHTKLSTGVKLQITNGSLQERASEKERDSGGGIDLPLLLSKEHESMAH
jgi:hypothetical protein